MQTFIGVVGLIVSLSLYFYLSIEQIKRGDDDEEDEKKNKRVHR